MKTIMGACRLCCVMTILVFGPAVVAQTQSSLRGVVKDQKTGEPLVGAQITIEGMNLGASTNMDGQFVILGVPAGTYTIKVSYIGFSSKTIENVRVGVGQTSNLSIEMPSAAVELPPVEIEPPPKQSAPPPTREAPPGEDFPAFPWPPPRSSTFMVLDRQLLATTKTLRTLGDVSETLERALNKAGYSERSYYYVPEGFALACRIEHILPDGAPAPDRWSVNLQAQLSFTVMSYFKALLTATPGYYRVVVFIVTSTSFHQSPNSPTKEEVTGWLNSGSQNLPAHVRKLPYTHDYSCTALIYEFKRNSVADNPMLMNPSQLDARSHIEKAGIMKGFGQ